MASSSSSPHHFGKTLKFEKEDSEGKMTILPKDLNIVWGEDKRYWNVPNTGQDAELYQVSWLEVTGTVDKVDPNKNYEVGFKVSLTPDAFGWNVAPIYIMMKWGKKGKFAWTKCTLSYSSRVITVTSEKAKKSSEDSDSKMIYFGMYEVWSGKWKGGLKIHEAFVRELP